MARIDYKTCEPFRAWNRLEGRTRKEDFDQSLRAEVHDPLWFLTRQWQFGEFKGEDTGSAIFAKIHIENTKISQVQLQKSTPASYTDELPLETLVERTTTLLDYKARIQASKHFMRILDKNGQGVTGYNRAIYLKKLVDKYLFAIPLIEEGTDSNALVVQKAKRLTNHGLGQFYHIVKGREFDGVALYEDLQANNGLSTTVDFLAQAPAHKPIVQDSLTGFTLWFEQKFDVNSAKDAAWNEQHLEYQFGCALPNNTGNNSVLLAEEYYTGKLDWYAFDVLQDPEGMTQSTDAERQSHISTETLTIIPTAAQFSGMPNARWWEFEDGEVDLGNINASTTDVAKIILAEFALIYGNDWFAMPYRIPVGSISEIKGIVVTDVFGQKTLVESASQGQSEDWSGWGMFNLSARKIHDETAIAAVENSISIPADTRLFIPPTTAKVQESEVIESVHFVRDEMANLVWALETSIPDLLGRGSDGHAAARELKLLLDQINDVENQEIEIADEAMLRYILSNTVPENWIPFTAVHAPAQNRKVRLQRASMPRLMKDGFMAVRPRTELLRYGMHGTATEGVQPFVNANAEDQNEPYFIIEEEITKTGVHIKGTNQRTRWYSGKTFNWRGRRKTLGRGEGASGLFYDCVEFVQAKEEQS